MAASLNIGQVFGERLREVRLKRKLTQAQVAERSGLLQHHISQLENGVGMPTLATLLKLAAAIGCKPTDLLSVFNAMDLRSLLPKRRAKPLRGASAPTPEHGMFHGVLI